MNHSEEILNELKGVAPLLQNIIKGRVYIVPSGYFENLTGDITIRTTLDTFSKIQINNFHSIPTGYFENFPSHIISVIKLEKSSFNEVQKELFEVAPFLNNIKKQSPYLVPSFYFDRVVSLPPKEKLSISKVYTLSNSRKWFSYAVAACIATVIGLGTFLFINKNTKTIDYATTIKTDLSKSLNNLSSMELQNELETNNQTDFVINDDNGTTLIQELTNVEEGLQVLTDEELEQFLNESKTLDEVKGSKS